MYRKPAKKPFHHPPPLNLTSLLSLSSLSSWLNKRPLQRLLLQRRRHSKQEQLPPHSIFEPHSHLLIMRTMPLSWLRMMSLSTRTHCCSHSILCSTQSSIQIYTILLSALPLTLTFSHSFSDLKVILGLLTSLIAAFQHHSSSLQTLQPSSSFFSSLQTLQSSCHRFTMRLTLNW